MGGPIPIGSSPCPSPLPSAVVSVGLQMRTIPPPCAPLWPPLPPLQVMITFTDPQMFRLCPSALSLPSTPPSPPPPPRS